MAYFETYNPSPIKASLVPKEGIYQCKVQEVLQGTTEDGKRYAQVKCVINCEGRPVVSVFLTEGSNFNGNLTAFYDTFGIERGNMEIDHWIGKMGFLKINLVKKGEFTNMVSRYILNEEGFVVPPNHNKNGNVQLGEQPKEHFTHNESATGSYGDLGDIPF